MTNEQLTLLLDQLAIKIGTLEVNNVSLNILIGELQKENEELKKQLSESKGEMK